MEGLKNMMEDNVEQMLNHLLPTMPNVCSCNDCKLDMATYALNRLHPKYARTTKGAILHRFDTASAQVEAEILTACVSAINIIGSHPHHNEKDANSVKETAAVNNTGSDASATAAPDDNNASGSAQTPVAADSAPAAAVVNNSAAAVGGSADTVTQ